MEEAVTCAIRGVRPTSQVEDNLAAAELAPIPADAMKKARELYDAMLKPIAHHYW